MPAVDQNNPGWRQIIARYQKPDLHRSLWQLINSLVPYIILWYLMVLSLQVSYWLTLGLAVLAAGFLMRIFIIFHDCGHGSFFASSRANEMVGFITGLLTFTPTQHWWHNHAIHHATAGNLDRRGIGDVMMLTVDEYLALPRWKRLGYRVMRFPLIMFGIGPSLVFLVAHRFVRPGSGRRERASVHLMNFTLLTVLVLLGLWIGFETLVLVQLPIVVLGTSAGVWLFYIQHQFDGVYWARRESWKFIDAGLRGSSYYQLPRLLQWFTGNIGFHHIHHLGPRIPNYNLETCQKENPFFQQVKPVTIRLSLKALAYRLYDEDQKRMVGFGVLKERSGEPAALT